MSSFPSENEVIEACRVLFGGKVIISRDFLFYLQPGGAKTAYRKKVKETHPDLYQGEDPDTLQQQTENFREAKQAYELVSHFLREREEHLRQAFQSSPRPHQRGDSTRRAKAGTPPSTPPAPVKTPSRELEIGLFLFYRKVISSRTLAEALLWQRKQRAAFGEVARYWGWLTDSDIDRIRATHLPFSRFGERAVHLGLLTPVQVRTLLFYQRARQKRLGDFFVERGLVTRPEMERHVKDLRQHNARVRADLRSKDQDYS